MGRRRHHAPLPPHPWCQVGQSLWQMHPMGPDPRGQPIIGPNQQPKAPLTGQAKQPAGDGFSLSGPEGTIDQGLTWPQASG